jgi:hypothetical protein
MVDNGGNEITVKPVKDPEEAAPLAPTGYNPWVRWRTYVSFFLGIGSASTLFLCIMPHAIVAGWLALGMGLPAWLIGKKEIAEVPQSATHGFVKWGIRTGMLGTFVGPLTAIVWTVGVLSF